MNEKVAIRRKILLKLQTQQVIRGDLDDLRFQRAALRYRDQLERRMGERFNPDLSARLDSLQVLIDSFGRQPLGGAMRGYPDYPRAGFSRSGGDL